MTDHQRSRPAPWFRGLALLVVLGLVRPAAAQTPAGAPAGAPVEPGSWAAQLDSLVRWAEQHRGPAACAERCFALQRLRLTGSLQPSGLQFELEGSVLAEGPTVIPLFGPPGHLRVEDVTEDGHPAAMSFGSDNYYVVTAARHFVLRGRLTLQDDLALTIPGPLNTLDAELTGARVVEGAHLAGLAGATVHFDRGASQPVAAGPTVFQLSHAVRVGREITFTYRLVMQSGADLGVVRLPLRDGERVLDVAGATGWRTEGTDLLLPTSGRSAEMTVTGTLTQVGAFTPDPRSEYEWWLFEGDAEHRMTVTGDARQMDSSESPIPRTQPTSRLYMVPRGHRIEVAVQSLVSVDALAAVVHGHDRTAVLTRSGDVVTDDTLRYENNGIDYLLYDPAGRPIFLATDGTSERIMHRDRAAAEILVPLRTGAHTARVQALAHRHIARFGGRMEFPIPTYPLTASRVTFTLALPAHVHPVGLLGGDRAVWLYDGRDLAALAAAVLAAAVAFRTRGRRALGALALGGLWFVSPGWFTAVLGALAVAGLAWLLGRLLRGPTLVAAYVVTAGGAALVALAMLTSKGEVSPVASTTLVNGSEFYRDNNNNGPVDLRTRGVPATPPTANGVATAAGTTEIQNRFGSVVAQTAEGGVLQGVTPVALTLPGYERTVTVSRELVTHQRPFRPVLLYFTGTALLPLLLAWLVCVAALVRAHRAELGRLRDRVRARIERGPAPAAP